MDSRPIDSLQMFLVGIGLAVAWRLDALLLALILGVPLAALGWYVNVSTRSAHKDAERIRELELARRVTAGEG
jgi:hypothetical protein